MLGGGGKNWRGVRAPRPRTLWDWNSSKRVLEYYWLTFLNQVQLFFFLRSKNVNYRNYYFFEKVLNISWTFHPFFVRIEKLLRSKKYLKKTENIISIIPRKFWSKKRGYYMKMAIMGLDIVDWESAQVDLHTLSIVKQLLLITLHFLAQDLYSSIRWWTPWNSWARRKTSRKCWSLPTAKSTWCDFKQTAARVHGSRRHTMRAHYGRTLCSLTSLSSSVVDARVN